MIIQKGIIRFNTNDSLAVVGAVFALLALWLNPLVFSTLGVICGITSKFMKSKYWWVVIFVSLGGYAIYLLHML